MDFGKELKFPKIMPLVAYGRGGKMMTACVSKSLQICDRYTDDVLIR